MHKKSSNGQLDECLKGMVGRNKKRRNKRGLKEDGICRNDHYGSSQRVDVLKLYISINLYGSEIRTSQWTIGEQRSCARKHIKGMRDKRSSSGTGQAALWNNK